MYIVRKMCSKKFKDMSIFEEEKILKFFDFIRIGNYSWSLKKVQI